MKYPSKSSSTKGLRNGAGKHIPSQNRKGGKVRHNRRKTRNGLAKGQHLKRRGGGGVQNKHPSGLMPWSVVVALLLTEERRKVGPKGDITFFKKAPVTLRKVKKVKSGALKRDRSDLLKARAKARSHTVHPRRRFRKTVVEVDGVKHTLTRGTKPTPKRAAINPVAQGFTNVRVFVPGQIKRPSGKDLRKMSKLSKKQRAEHKFYEPLIAWGRDRIRDYSKDVPIVRAKTGRQDARTARGFDHLSEHAVISYEREARQQLIHQCKYPVGMPKSKKNKPKSGYVRKGMDLRLAIAQALIASPPIPMEDVKAKVRKSRTKRDESNPDSVINPGGRVQFEQAIKSDARTFKHHQVFIDAKTLIASKIDTARKNGHSPRGVPVHSITEGAKVFNIDLAKKYANAMAAPLRQTVREDLMDREARKTAYANRPDKAARQLARTAKAARVAEELMKLKTFVAAIESSEETPI